MQLLPWIIVNVIHGLKKLHVLTAQKVLYEHLNIYTYSIRPKVVGAFLFGHVI